MNEESHITVTQWQRFPVTTKNVLIAVCLLQHKGLEGNFKAQVA